MDWPPSFGKLTINALAAAHRVLIPCIPDYVSVQGLARLAQTIDQVRISKLNPGLQIAGVLMTRVRANTKLHQDWVATVRDSFCAAHHCPLLGVIPETIRVGEAGGAGIAITRYPDSNEVRAAYQAVAAQLWGGSAGA